MSIGNKHAFICKQCGMCVPVGMGLVDLISGHWQGVHAQPCERSSYKSPYILNHGTSNYFGSREWNGYEGTSEDVNPNEGSK